MSTEHTQPARAELLPIELLASPFVRFAVGRKSKLRRMQTPGKRCFPEEVGQCWRDTLGPVIGGNLNDIKEFIKAQPPSTVIGIGYMSNAGVKIDRTDFSQTRSRKSGKSLPVRARKSCARLKRY
jgi:hypothetical protein